MLVLLPKRPSRSDHAPARPTVALPAPVPNTPPSVAPPTVAPPQPEPGGNKTLVTVVPPGPAATGRQSKSGWPFPFDPPPEPKEGDNQALAVNTTDGSTTYVVALSLVWVTDGSPVDQRNTAYAAASCTGCRTVAIAFQAVFVIGYAQVVTPANAAVAVNYDCDTCSTGALAIQLVVTLTRGPSEPAMGQLAAVWAQLEQESKSFQLLPLDQVYAELSATRAQLLEILARDGDLPPDATTTSVSQDGSSGTTAGDTTTSTNVATTTTFPASQTTSGTSTTSSDETATTNGGTTTDDRTTTGATTAETTTGQTTTAETTTGQTTTAETTTGQTTTTTP